MTKTFAEAQKDYRDRNRTISNVCSLQTLIFILEHSKKGTTFHIRVYEFMGQKLILPVTDPETNVKEQILGEIEEAILNGSLKNVEWDEKAFKESMERVNVSPMKFKIECIQDGENSGR